MPALAHSMASASAAAPPTPHLPSADLLPPEIFHNHGQYSPWFPAHEYAEYGDAHDHCTVTFVSQLERHGSRYPTGGAYNELSKTLRQIAKHLKRVPDAAYTHDEANEGLDPELQWLRHWVETKKSREGGLRDRLGNSELTPYGQYEAYSSGWRFYEKYAHLFSFQQVDINADYATDSSSHGAESNRLLDLICGTREPPVTSSTFPAFQLLSSAVKSICHYIGSEPKHPQSKHESRPFVRASGADRVITSSRFFLQGFAHSPHRPFRHASPESAPWPPKGRPVYLDSLKSHKPHRRIHHLPHPDVIIPEARKSDKAGQIASNNTLDVYTCSAFERDFRDNAQSPASRKVAAFAHNATSAIRHRLATQLGVRKGGSKDRRGERLHLEPKEVLQLFSLCAFDTVARLDPYGLLYGEADRNKGAISPFCSLFKDDEFASIYEVSTDLEKDYGFAAHQPYHKALAAPWLRELVARLQQRMPVMDPPTSINTTLDKDPDTFPLPSQTGPKAYVDFTHDNQLAPIIASLGLWDEEHEWQTATTTPFSGRMTVEKLKCGQGEYIQILVNDQPAKVSSGSWCKDAEGDFADAGQHLCPLGAFLQPLEWVDRADEWDKCYSESTKDDTIVSYLYQEA